MEQQILDIQWNETGTQCAHSLSSPPVVCITTGSNVISFQLSAPCNRLSWAHPSFGQIIALAVDANVLIYKEVNGKWTEIYVYQHQALVTDVKFHPHSSSLILATSAIDGHITWHYFKDHQWTTRRLFTHQNGVNALSWASPFSPNAITLSRYDFDSNSLKRILFSVGNDNHLRIWNFPHMETNEINITECYSVQFNSPLFDVSCSHSLSRSCLCVAVCSSDGLVSVVLLRNTSPAQNDSTRLHFDHGKTELVQPENYFPRRIGFSPNGEFLGVSCKENTIIVWHEDPSTMQWKVTSLVSPLQTY